MKKIKPYLIVIGLLVVIMFACKKQEPQMTTEVTNPCDCATEVSAEFAIEVGFPAGLPYNELEMKMQTDTVYDYNTVWFTAKEKKAQYTWYAGIDVLHEKQIIRVFPSSFIGQTIPITLVVKKEPNLKCNPDDDGYDSIVKYVTVVSGDRDNLFYTSQPRWEGVFRMKDSTQNDSIDMTFNLGWGWNHIGDPLDYSLKIYNYNGLGDSISIWSTSTYYYNYIGLGSISSLPPACYSPGGYLKREYATNNYELLLPTLMGSSCEKQFHYYGRKL